MNVTSEQRVDVNKYINEDKYLIFGYTPTCGTCKVSERMLDIANDILQLPIIKWT